MRFAFFWDLALGRTVVCNDVRVKPSFPSSRVKQSRYSYDIALPSKTGQAGRPETLVRDYRSTLGQLPKQRKSHLCFGNSNEITHTNRAKIIYIIWRRACPSEGKSRLIFKMFIGVNNIWNMRCYKNINYISRPI
jgi:hypothetical protein